MTRRRDATLTMQPCRKPKTERELDRLSKFSIAQNPPKEDNIIDTKPSAGTIVFTHGHDRLGGGSHPAQGTLATGHAAKDARLAQEPERADEAEDGQASSRPQDGREVIRRSYSRRVLSWGQSSAYQNDTKSWDIYAYTYRKTESINAFAGDAKGQDQVTEDPHEHQISTERLVRVIHALLVLLIGFLKRRQRTLDGRLKLTVDIRLWLINFLNEVGLGIILLGLSLGQCLTLV